MTITRSLYTAGVTIAYGLSAGAGRGGGKLARAVGGMRGSVARLEAWAASSREPDRPLVWFHAPSVGEGFQARAVMESLRTRRPDAQVAYTFFSPSAEPFARAVPADVTDYFPPDLPWLAARVLDALRPDVIAFSKTEVWPNLVHAASERGIPSVLLSATLPASSSRLRLPARPLLADAHRELALVAAIAREDADRYASLGISPTRRVVMGDARFDQVALRASRFDPTAPLIEPLVGGDAPVLVAGSTWPADEDQLLDALDALTRSGVGLRLILAPHEPTPAALGRITTELDRRAISHRTLTELSWGDEPDVVLVDRMGILGDLYGVADIAYVGGGFGRAGLHSVLEPAAYGIPVLFGPAHDNAREAAELIDAGAAIAVTDSRGIERRLRAWISDAVSRGSAGDSALRYVTDGRGAAERGAAIIADLLESRPVREEDGPR